MRWLAFLLITGLVAGGVARQHRIDHQPSLPQLRSDANVAKKLAPRRPVFVRGVVADRRDHPDEVFVVEHAIAIAAPTSFAIVTTAPPLLAPHRNASVEQVARGPPLDRA